MVVRGIKRQNRDAGGQLVQGQQGIPVEFLGNGGGGDLGYELSCDCFYCSQALQGSKETSRSPAYS